MSEMKFKDIFINFNVLKESVKIPKENFKITKGNSKISNKILIVNSLKKILFPFLKYYFKILKKILRFNELKINFKIIKEILRTNINFQKKILHSKKFLKEIF